MDPMIFSFKSKVDVVLFDVLNNGYSHVINAMVSEIEMFPDGIRRDVMSNIEPMIAESCLKIVLGLSYILFLAFFAGDEINDIFGSTVGGVLTLKCSFVLGGVNSFAVLIYKVAHFAAGIVTFVGSWW